MSPVGIPRSAVRYRPLTESVQEFVVLSPRASKEKPGKLGQRTDRSRLWWQPKSGHPLVLVGVGMLVTVLLVLVSQVVVPWGMKTADDVQYGYPRTTQEDHYVGHEQRGTPSHFVAMNVAGADHGGGTARRQSQRGAVVGRATDAGERRGSGSSEAAVCGRREAPGSGGEGAECAGAFSQHGQDLCFNGSDGMKSAASRRRDWTSLCWWRVCDTCETRVKAGAGLIFGEK